MKLVKIFTFLTIILLLLIFLMRNFERVSVDLILVKYDQISLAIVMVFAVAIGILIGFGGSLSTILSAKADVHSIRQKNRQITGAYGYGSSIPFFALCPCRNGDRRRSGYYPVPSENRQHAGKDQNSPETQTNVCGCRSDIHRKRPY